MGFPNRLKFHLYSTTVVFLCMNCLHCSSTITSDSPKLHTRIIIQSTNSENFTLFSEDTDANPTQSSILATSPKESDEYKPWKTKGFQEKSVSQLLSEHSSISLPPSNNSRFFLAHEISSFTLIIKNFSNPLMYLNFSYFVSMTFKNSTIHLEKTLNTVANSPSLPQAGKLDAEGDSRNDKIISKSSGLASTLFTATTTTQSPVLMTPANNPQQSTNFSNPPAANSTQTSRQDTSVLVSPLVIMNVKSTSDTSSTLVAAASVLLNAASQSQIKEDRINSSKLVEMENNTFVNFHQVISNNTEDQRNSAAPVEITNLNMTDLHSHNFTNVSAMPVPELIPITHDMARRKRSPTEDAPADINATINIETATTDRSVAQAVSQDASSVVIIKSTNSSASDNPNIVTNSPSPYPLPVYPTTEAVEVSKTVAVTAAVTASKSGNGATPETPVISTGHVVTAAPSNPTNTTSNIGNSGSSPALRETDSNFPGRVINSKRGNKTDERNKAGANSRHEHRHRKSKNSITSAGTPTTSSRGKRKKVKKVKTVERNEKMNTNTNGNDDIREDSSSSSSSSEEHVGGTTGKQKISYKTWRASLEKRNRPPGLYVTVNDDIIFDNWDGVWDKQHIMGKWSGTKMKPTEKDKWNHTSIFTSWEDIKPGHDVKISFEWEPVDENFLVVLSDIVVSTIGIPPCAPSEEILAKNQPKTQITGTLEDKQEVKETPTPHFSNFNTTSTNSSSSLRGDYGSRIIVLRQRAESVGNEWEVIKIGDTDVSSQNQAQIAEVLEGLPNIVKDTFTFPAPKAEPFDTKPTEIMNTSTSRSETSTSSVPISSITSIHTLTSSTLEPSTTKTTMSPSTYTLILSASNRTEITPSPIATTLPHTTTSTVVSSVSGSTISPLTTQSAPSTISVTISPSNINTTILPPIVTSPEVCKDCTTIPSPTNATLSTVAFEAVSTFNSTNSVAPKINVTAAPPQSNITTLPTGISATTLSVTSRSSPSLASIITTPRLKNRMSQVNETNTTTTATISMTPSMEAQIPSNNIATSLPNLTHLTTSSTTDRNESKNMSLEQPPSIKISFQEHMKQNAYLHPRTQHHRERNTDIKSALYVLVGTATLSGFILGFLLWRKSQLVTKGINATR